MLLSFDLEARRTHCAPKNPSAIWTPLADGLARELEPWLTAALPLPERKARLTRDGGRCPVHGVFLEFDPASPHDHRCARCDISYQGRTHDDWWAMGAQLWTAERAVHAAALYLLRGRVEHGDFTARVLRSLADRYTSWKNSDNVLGPSRPFFSTYLESIWLLNISQALSLLEASESSWTAVDARNIRQKLLSPSAQLIAGFHERGSNRQVWNEAAICSAWMLLGEDRAVRARLDSEGGLRWQIAHGLDESGSWYEGENYHLFAHRGLWYGVELMRAMGEPLSAHLSARYSAGFVAPFRGLLPDETFPSRKDSQYASSIRQWRTAEWCELGWTHTRDKRLAGILARLYDQAVPSGDTARARSTADAERNTPAVALSRADLSWRALLMAEAASLPHAAVALASSCEPSEGRAVIRRDHAHVYVALEGGQLGGGHGHPDQLALTLQTGVARWLQDPGTGSYVEPELRWYRSTLAHAAPLVDTASQPARAARLVAYDERGGAGWICKRVNDIAPGVAVERTIVVCDGYLLDVVEWFADRVVTLELPIAGEASVAEDEDVAWTPSVARGASPSVRDDGLNAFIERQEQRTIIDRVALSVSAGFADPARPAAIAANNQRALVWYAANRPSTVERAIVPAVPGQGAIRRHWLASNGAGGRIVGVWSWPTARYPDGIVSSLALDARDEVGAVCATVVTRDGTTAAHSRVAHGWHIDLTAGGARSSLDLEGLIEESVPASPVARTSLSHIPSAQWGAVIHVPHVLEANANGAPGETIVGARSVPLGEVHYVQTEQPWRDADAPTAALQIGCTAESLIVDVLARTGEVVARPVSCDNPLDNEIDDTNADGVQWYINPSTIGATPLNTSLSDEDDASWYAAGLHVPVGEGRSTPLRMGSAVPALKWREVADGWAMRLVWSRTSLPVAPDGSIAFELVVNERPPDRERRRGQLVLSGGGGFGFLAGSRRSANRHVTLILDDEKTPR